MLDIRVNMRLMMVNIMLNTKRVINQGEYYGNKIKKNITGFSIL